MGFEFLETSRTFRRSQVKRRRSWQRFWLAFSIGTILIIGALALLKAIKATQDVPEPVVLSGPPPEFFQAPEPQPNVPDILKESPSKRPPPEAVNEFLREEQALNSGRLELLRQRQVKLEPVDFAARCLPQWDFRSLKREVIWFYSYASGAVPDGRKLTVFGAVDGLGQPLFQHPPMAGDPLALLDSQYVGLKWIALEEPRLALVAGVNGPWPRCGAVVDLFLVNSPASQSGTRFWRFDDASYAEKPPTSSRLICFQDTDGDDLRDLCAFWFSGEGSEARPSGISHRFDPEQQSFAVLGAPLEEEALSALQAQFERISAGDQLTEPFLVADPATERVFKDEAVTDGP